MKKEESKEIMKRLNEASFVHTFKSKDVEEEINENMLVVSLHDAFNILSKFEEEVLTETVAKLQVEITINDVGKVLDEILREKNKRLSQCSGTLII